MRFWGVCLLTLKPLSCNESRMRARRSRVMTSLPAKPRIAACTEKQNLPPATGEAPGTAASSRTKKHLQHCRRGAAYLNIALDPKGTLVIRVAVVVVLLGNLLFPASAWANSAVPGPLIIYGSSMSVSPWLWVLVTMAMCISVEASVYAYSGQYRRPVLASTYSNFISLIFGIPLSFLGAVDPTWFVLPTIVSVCVEYWVLRAGAKWFENCSGSIKGSPIFWGNLLSNLILLGLFFVAVKKQ